MILCILYRFEDLRPNNIHGRRNGADRPATREEVGGEGVYAKVPDTPVGVINMGTIQAHMA